jgi:uncharacterized membrane protein YqhA
MLGRILASSRFLILIAVLGSFIGAVTTIVFGAITTVLMSLHFFQTANYTMQGIKQVSVDFIELIDLFLLGTVLYIMAIGLYELFIDPDIPLPKWLHTESLDVLKEKLLGVIAVLLGVSFLGEVSEWEDANDILYLGLAIAAVIIGFAVLLFTPIFNKHGKTSPKDGEHSDAFDAKEL